MNVCFTGTILAAYNGGREAKENCYKIIEMLTNFGNVFTERIDDKKPNYSDETRSNNKVFKCKYMDWAAHIANALVVEISYPCNKLDSFINRIAKDIPVLCLVHTEDVAWFLKMIEKTPGVTVCKYKSIDEVPKILLNFFAQFPTS